MSIVRKFLKYNPILILIKLRLAHDVVNGGSIHGLAF